LTNGIEYKFFTDLEEPNKMDQKPFFVFNMLDLRDTQINEISKFKKSDFDVINVLTTASDLKYTNEIKQFLSKQWEEPSDEFVRLIINEVYQGIKTKKVLDIFKDIVKKSLNQFVNEKVNDKLQQALNSDTAESKKSDTFVESEVIELREEFEPTRIYYRDNRSYFNVLLDDNIRKWICRLGFNSSNKYIQLNDEMKTSIKIESVNDIQNYKNEIINVAKQFA
jgi:hypothetical protein